jgi:hypothetical protein
MSHVVAKRKTKDAAEKEAAHVRKVLRCAKYKVRVSKRGDIYVVILD